MINRIFLWFRLIFKTVKNFFIIHRYCIYTNISWSFLNYSIYEILNSRGNIPKLAIFYFPTKYSIFKKKHRILLPQKNQSVWLNKFVSFLKQSQISRTRDDDTNYISISRIDSFRFIEFLARKQWVFHIQWPSIKYLI